MPATVRSAPLAVDITCSNLQSLRKWQSLVIEKSPLVVETTDPMQPLDMGMDPSILGVDSRLLGDLG